MRKGQADEVLRVSGKGDEGRNNTQSNGYTTEWTSGQASEPVGVCRLSPEVVGCTLRVERPSGCQPPTPRTERSKEPSAAGPSGPRTEWSRKQELV